MSTEQAGHRDAPGFVINIGRRAGRARGRPGVPRREADGNHRRQQRDVLDWLIDQAAQACVHLAAGAAEADGVQCLHLIAVPRPAPGTMRLVSPDLACGRVPVV